MKAEVRTVRATVNGEQRSGEVEVRTPLTEFLRSVLRLTGTHVGCEHGVCGACTVLVDGVAVRSCLMLAVQVDGRDIETVESLASDEQLSDLQRAMSEQHGLQCGFCTPGILMALTAAERERADEEAVVSEVLGGHMCRCTGYQNIRAAIRQHWAALAETGQEARP
jgi:aerobic-type carbon monoxide dehydrogenase small subunit (CoxS/CutS family)